MKKYIPSIFVAALAASFAPAEETETVAFTTDVALPTLPQTFLVSACSIGTNSLSATTVKDFANRGMVNRGTNAWYGGVQSGSVSDVNNQMTITDFSKDENGADFNVRTRGTGHASTYAALHFNVGVLKTQIADSVANVTTVDTLTGSFVVGSINASISPATFSAWTYTADNGGVATQIGTTSTLVEGAEVSLSVDLTQLKDADSIILIWGATPTSTGAWKAYGVTDFSLSAVGTKTIPEPTTATLSLLALAGLAARRRRK